MKTLSIVIPCFNEEATIHEIISRVLALTVPDFRIQVIVVDDCSTDRTPQILGEFGDRIVTILQEKNGGKGTAVKKGLDHASGDYILIQDADLEYDPKEIPSLVSAVVDDKSVIYGTRNHTHSKRTGFWIPRLGVWLLTELVNLLYGSRLTDIWTCYKLFPQRTKSFFVNGRFEAEILFTLKLLRNGYDISEVPISHLPRPASEGKKIRYRDGLQAIGLILQDWFINIRQTLFSHKIFWSLAIVVIIALFAVTILKPFPDPAGDAPSYLVTMEVITSGVIPPDFIPHRLITTFGGLHSVIALSSILGDTVVSWIILNFFFYLLAAVFFYKILHKMYKSDMVAAIGTFFLAGNYASLSFGLNYYMDMGGWVFYLVSLYFLLLYTESKSLRHLVYAACAIGIGGLFKEYAFLACIPIALVLTVLHYRSWKVWLSRAVLATVLALGPTFVVHVVVYFQFGYTYADWLGANQAHYVYSSRVIEYIKSLGSLVHILGIVGAAGLYTLIRSRGKQIADSRHRIFLVGVFLSVLPIFFWPAITQRILFVVVPFVILVGSAFIKQQMKHRVLLFVLTLIYIVLSIYMGPILVLVNLPF